MADRCLQCHQNIAAERSNAGTLHGALQQKAGLLSCRGCHPDHRGAGAELTDLDIRTFPHDALGFSLKAHQQDANGQPFVCGDCHTQPSLLDFRQETCNSCHSQTQPLFMLTHRLDFGVQCTQCHDGVDTFGRKFDHNRTAFKLTEKHAGPGCADCHRGAQSLKDLQSTPTACSSCHLEDEPHAGRLGTSCEDCHTPRGWTPARFDHSLASFALTGRHAKLACTECHINGLLQGTPSACAACHRQDDPHQGTFRQDCGACHNANNWRDVKVDHNQFAFRLEGAHARAACTQCHVNNVYVGASRSCMACHSKDDKHNGQFPQECSACHNATSWKQVTVDHNAFGFRLTGAHVSIDCSKCHVNGQYVNTPQVCGACHTRDDAHSGQLGSDCERCHNTGAWKPASFDHRTSVFPLTGAHASVACSACHTSSRYKGTPQTCSGCHASDDAHRGQFGSDCAQCHTTSAWKPSTFDHNRAAFRLTGAHTGVACSSCHLNAVFKGTPTACGSCHARDDVHAGQLGSNCGQCHTTSAWKPANFNHNTTAFPLTGAHTGAACSSCHAGGVYRGTPTSCGSCHASDDRHNGAYGSNCGSCHSTSAWRPASFDHNLSDFPLTGAHTNLACSQCHGSSLGSLPTACSSCHGEPAYHAGMFGGQACDSCHNTSAWRPAPYNGPHSFPMNHGRADTCSDCHQPTLTTWSCFLCHRQSEMDDHHKEVANYDRNCLRCHPTGSKGDD